jgi:hypothetical protein
MHTFSEACSLVLNCDATVGRLGPFGIVGCSSTISESDESHRSMISVAGISSFVIFKGQTRKQKLRRLSTSLNVVEVQSLYNQVYYVRTTSTKPSTLANSSTRKPRSTLASAIKGDTLISVHPTQRFSTSLIAEAVDESAKSTTRTQIASNPPAGDHQSSISRELDFLLTTRHTPTNDSSSFNTRVE